MSEEPEGAPPPPVVLTPEELEQIPAGLRPKVERVLRFEMTTGPLPPPDMLARYDNVVPGLPEKLVKWTEDETLHRRSMQRTGQRSALMITLASFLAAVAISGLTDSVAFALVAGILPIVGVGGTVAARVLAGRWGSGPAMPPEPPEDKPNH